MLFICISLFVGAVVGYSCPKGRDRKNNKKERSIMKKTVSFLKEYYASFSHRESC